VCRDGADGCAGGTDSPVQLHRALSDAQMGLPLGLRAVMHAIAACLVGHERLINSVTNAVGSVYWHDIAVQ
jgi:hypothetical protein